jgi:hypothetical protein
MMVDKFLDDEIRHFPDSNHGHAHGDEDEESDEQELTYQQSIQN